MTSRRRIAVVGDHDPRITAHRAIPLALGRAVAESGAAVAWEWVGTTSIDPAARAIDGFDAVWIVPGSPYASTDGAISAVRAAREGGKPFLGTCAGFQHAMLEYARNVWGIADAAHAELDPGAPDPVLARMACSLVDVHGAVRPVAGTRLARIYGVGEAVEGYHCRYGLAPSHAARLESGPLRVCARDEAGDVRAVELEGHPFWTATLFQPERAALAGRSHPLIGAFVEAVALS